MKKLLLPVLLSLLCLTTLAQTGSISGTVNDGQLNDILPFANVVIEGTDKGTTSDFDGKYNLTVAPGTYALEFSFVGYNKQVITDVVVKENQTTIVDVTLSGASLEEIVITTTVRQNSEKSVLLLQKNAPQLVDALSLDAIKKAGASNIAAAIKNVTGVSVQGGKFVFVRGLGDRYTKSILNGVDVPGLDPDRNTLQLDIFPTSIIENIQVSKSFTADQPADFTGGVVDIVTKDIPARAEYTLNVGTNYNPDFHFNSDFILDRRSSTDFLGFDDGLRDNPINSAQVIPIIQESGEAVQLLTERFNSNLGIQNRSSFTDFNLGFTAGNSYDVGDDKIGYVASVNYRNQTQFFDDIVTNQQFEVFLQDASVLELEPNRLQSGSLGTNNVLLNGLLGLSYKRGNSKYNLNVLHIQNGESRASIQTQINSGDVFSTSIRNNIAFTERAITNILFAGKNSFKEGKWILEYKASPTFSSVNDRDLRSTPFLVDENNNGDVSLVLDDAEAGDVTRIFRTLQDVTLVGKADVTNKHELFSRDAKLKFGIAANYKTREFTQPQFTFQPENIDTSIFNGDPDQVLAPENIFDAETESGIAIRDNTSQNDAFDSNSSTFAAYVSEDFKATPWWTWVLGLRLENFNLNYTGFGQIDGVNTAFNNARFIEETNLFPSVNTIFDLDEDANHKIRAAYTRTTARPSFKEASTIALFDPIELTFFIGNQDIQPTFINNFDLRLEKYGENGDFYALSGFYKTFVDPIERTFFAAASNQFTVVNLGNSDGGVDATVVGLELELRKNLGFIGLNDFSFNFNWSLIDSEQTLNADEAELRTNALRTGETLPDNRALQGQSPFIVNAGLNYDNQDLGIKAGLFYNVQGTTLEIVGGGSNPDVFTSPFNSLNFNVSKDFGKDDKSKISLRVRNLLDDDIESVFSSFGAQDQIFATRSPGQSFSLSYSYSF